MSQDSARTTSPVVQDQTVGQPMKSEAAGARRVGINAASLLASDVLNRGATFAIYALVASYCGAYSFGQLSLGLMLLYSFQVFASVGMPTLIVRDVAKTPKSDAKYFVHACIIVFLAFALCYAALALFVVASGYAADTSRVIMLLGLSILPWSLALIVEALFRAKERMHLILWAAVPVHFAKLGFAFYLLTQGYGVEAIAIVLLTAHVLVFLIQLGILLPTLNSRLPRFNWRFCQWMLNNSWKFGGIDALVALWASVNVVLLSWYSGEAAVGVFGAAMQLLIPPTIALQAVANSLFPIMCRRAEENRERSRALVVMMFEVLTFIAVPGVVLLCFCAEPLIELIYRNQGFVDSAMLVRIMSLCLVFKAMTRLLGQLLMSYRREHVNLRIVAAGVAFNVVCGVILIPALGVTGAAITVLVTGLVDCALHLLATRSLLVNESRSSDEKKFLVFWCTLASTAAMAAVFVVIGDAHFLVAITAAVTTFFITFVLLCWLFQGGTLSVRERFLMPLSES